VSYARMLGLAAVRVDAPEQVGDAWDEALAAKRPFLIEAITDRDMPLLPPFMPDDKIDKLHIGISAEGGHRDHLRDQIERQALQPEQRRPTAV